MFVVAAVFLSVAVAQSWGIVPLSLSVHGLRESLLEVLHSCCSIYIVKNV